jgi:hypothetical protein
MPRARFGPAARDLLFFHVILFLFKYLAECTSKFQIT